MCVIASDPPSALFSCPAEDEGSVVERQAFASGATAGSARGWRGTGAIGPLSQSLLLVIT